jgi:hypothetical protein
MIVLSYCVTLYFYQHDIYNIVTILALGNLAEVQLFFDSTVGPLSATDVWAGSGRRSLVAFAWGNGATIEIVECDTIIDAQVRVREVIVYLFVVPSHFDLFLLTGAVPYRTVHYGTCRRGRNSSHVLASCNLRTDENENSQNL